MRMPWPIIHQTRGDFIGKAHRFVRGLRPRTPSRVHVLDPAYITHHARGDFTGSMSLRFVALAASVSGRGQQHEACALTAQSCIWER